LAYPIETLLQLMSGKTITLGWDAVVAYDMDTVNTLFAQQYVQNVSANQHFPPLTTTIEIAEDTLSLVVSNLTLGPPLISFSGANAATQQANVTMNFIAGELIVLTQAGSVEYVSAYQTITPADQYALDMLVDLKQVTGEVEDHKKVVVDLANAQNYTANLLSGSGAANLLGEYFQTLFQKEAQGTLTYELGSLVFGSEVNLVPTMFEIRTQAAPSGGSDGAVLLFVATTYNPNGGSLPGEDYPYLIPDGFSGALVVGSNTLFGNIMGPTYEKELVGNATVTTHTFDGENAASYISFTGGNAATPQSIKYTWTTGGGVWHSIWSGSKGNGTPNYQPVQVPYQGLTVQPANDLLAISWSNQWGQEFGASTVEAKTGATSSSDQTVNLTISADMTAAASVANNVVSFAGSGSPSVTFGSSGWVAKWFGNGELRDMGGAAVAAAAQPVAQAVLNVQVPQVDVFAVDHLLFPSSNAMQLSAVHIPGDLALFGAVTAASGALTVTPLQAVVARGQTQQFAASQSPATWTCYPRIGSISAAGLYTAPTSRFAGPIAVTATANQNTAQGVVVVVPMPVAVSPAFSVVQPGAQPLAIACSVVGGATPAWSITPSDGSLGTIDQTGTYTPPATIPAGIAAAVVTAAADGQSASAVLCLVNAAFAIPLTPPYTPTPLSAGKTQQFASAIPKQRFALTLNWSICPQLGTITQQGLYTAPDTIAAPAAVAVMVQAEQDTDLIGLAVVMLAPAHGG
jgi:hypothetical protein